MGDESSVDRDGVGVVGRRRGGFVFVLVLVLLVVSTATIGWSLTRARAQAAVVQLQLDEYQRHHEMLGVRAIVKDWLTDRDVTEALAEMAFAGGISHVVELPTGELVSLSVADGQGEVLARLDVALTDVQRELLVEILSQIPADQRELTRTVGPVQMSLRGAPAPVLLAATRGDFELFNLVSRLRGSPDLNRAKLLQEIRSAGFRGSEGQELLSMFTLDPVLWRVNVEVVTDRTLNRYTLLAEVAGNVVEVLEWRAIMGDAAFPGGGGVVVDPGLSQPGSGADEGAGSIPEGELLGLPPVEAFDGGAGEAR